MAYVRAESQRYYGAKASLNVWNPQVEREEDFSIAQIWVASRDGVVNTVEAGLQVIIYNDLPCTSALFELVCVNQFNLAEKLCDQVDPLRFGDREVRLFNFWTVHTQLTNSSLLYWSRTYYSL